MFLFVYGRTFTKFESISALMGGRELHQLYANSSSHLHSNQILRKRSTHKFTLATLMGSTWGWAAIWGSVRSNNFIHYAPRWIGYIACERIWHFDSSMLYLSNPKIKCDGISRLKVRHPRWHETPDRDYEIQFKISRATTTDKSGTGHWFERFYTWLTTIFGI